MSQVLVLSHVLLWVCVVVQAVIIMALMRQVGSLLLRVGSSPAFDAGVGPLVGELAPWEPDGLDRGDRLLLLTFVSTTCGTCDALVPAVNAVAKAYESRLSCLVLAREDAKSLRTWSRKTGLTVSSRSLPDAFRSYSVEGTPYAFAIDASGRIAARGGVNHLEQLESLLRKCPPFESLAMPVMSNAPLSAGEVR